MKRHTNKNDFRASGTKKFDFNFDVDLNLLNTAYEIKKKFDDSPFLSMDFVFDNRDSRYKLVEFQALHFGTSVLVKNHCYFIKKGENWEKVEQVETVEYELALGLSKYLKGQQ